MAVRGVGAERSRPLFSMKNAVLFHISGWKKLKDWDMDALEFSHCVQDVLSNVLVYDYCGMVEQLGSVFMECKHGHMRCSSYFDLIIYHLAVFSVAGQGERGLIELLSVLPVSYPKHILITEDEGEILGIEDCLYGRKGKYFKLHGGIKIAELRECSNTYEQR